MEWNCLAAGYDADIVIFDDNVNIEKVFAKGELVCG